MKDLFLPITKQDYEKGTRAPKHLIIPEASVRLQTSEGKQRFPAGTMFQAIPFLPTNERHKVPAGEMLGNYESTEERPLYTTITVHWSRAGGPQIRETESSLRRKIGRAEGRARAFRAVLIGAAAGTAVVTIEMLLPLVIRWVSHLPAIIGVMVATVQANSG